MTSVRDGPESPYTAHAVLDENSLASIREANLAFLSLIAGDGATSANTAEALGFGPQLAARVRDLDDAGRCAVADCPYTLFNLRFEDATFWRGFGHACGAPCASVATGLESFARMAVFLAWHLARSNDLAASLVLGMTPEVQCSWRAIPLSTLERAAPAVIPHLRARWGPHPTFWAKLLSTAAPAGRERAEAVRLLGLQLLAADGAWPPLTPSAAIARLG